MTDEQYPPATVLAEAPVSCPDPAISIEPGAGKRRIRAGSAADLLAIIPHLLGFEPANSLVVIGTRPPDGRVIVTFRYDLPDPPDPDVTADITTHAIETLTRQRAETTLAVGYGPDRLVTPLADALRMYAPPAGLEVWEILRVEDNRYWSYMCGDDACCPPEGRPFDTSGHPATAVLTAAGAQVLSGREELAGTVAALDGEARESMRRATRRAEQRAARLVTHAAQPGQRTPARHPVADAGLKAVAKTLDRYRRGSQPVTSQQAAWLTVVLRDLWVRDDAWARMDPAHNAAHQRLWTDLTRRAQPGYVAAPASLLAFVAWQSGNGALANVALDRALADDPQYSMATLLRQVISSGAPPSLARLPMTPKEVAASYDQPEDSPAGDDPYDNADTNDACL
jgi:hypothetical protein